MSEQRRQDYEQQAKLHGAVTAILRAHNVDFDPTHVLDGGKVDTPVTAAERMLQAGVLSDAATKQLGELGIRV